jgi:hypothetical protein
LRGVAVRESGGPVIDVLLHAIYADEDALSALGWQVTGKLLEQVTGISVARGLAARCQYLPNADAVGRAIERMDLRNGSVAPLL